VCPSWVSWEPHFLSLRGLAVGQPCVTVSEGMEGIDPTVNAPPRRITHPLYSEFRVPTLKGPGNAALPCAWKEKPRHMTTTTSVSAPPQNGTKHDFIRKSQVTSMAPGPWIQVPKQQSLCGLHTLAVPACVTGLFSGTPPPPPTATNDGEGGFQKPPSYPTGLETHRKKRRVCFLGMPTKSQG
jgi:hypothetical protein